MAFSCSHARAGAFDIDSVISAAGELGNIDDQASVADTAGAMTDEERDGFNIIRTIAVSEVDAERIHRRDGRTYLEVLLDDTRQPIVRLHLTGNKGFKFVTTFEHGEDTPVRRDIVSVVDIYRVAGAQIRRTIRRYESGGAQGIRTP